MIISDKERRDIVRKLRAPKDSLLAYPDEELIRLRNEVRCRYKQDLYERLADLIDRPTTTRHGKFKTKYGRKIPCCEVCGYSIGDMRWSYCPKCGAEVVE